MRELAEKDRIIDYLLRQHDGPKANLDVTLQSAQAPVSNDIVTSLMLNKESCSQYSICNGGFGDVFLGKLKGGSQVAIKTMRYSVGSESENRKSLKHAALELYTWSKCRHPNVHPLLGLVEFRNQIGMVSTWEVNGNLSEHIRLRPTVDRCLLVR
ncbi:hypothetical protein FRC09_004484 [Ceratobasidium sp. 395]|nr:hypothetical protein FRC09_004484 [Ceratobasidium sp. 395]